jgi:hypothetical protein
LQEPGLLDPGSFHEAIAVIQLVGRY